MLRHGALAYEWNRYLGMASLASEVVARGLGLLGARIRGPSRAPRVACEGPVHPVHVESLRVELRVSPLDRVIGAISWCPYTDTIRRVNADERFPRWATIT